MLTESQMEKRKRHIGSSESAAILGVNPYATAYDIWARKTGRLPEFEGNEACDIGNMVESGLLDWAATERNDRIIRNQFRVHQGGILSATHDALSMDTSKIGYEAKTAGILNPWGEKDKWGEAGTDEIPEQYIVQCQHQMIVSGLDVVYVPALVAGRGRIMYTVTRNDTLCAMIEDECSRFWDKCILADTPPADSFPSERTIKEIRREQGKSVRIETDLVRAWREADEMAKNAAKAAELKKAAVIAAMGDATIGKSEIGSIVISRIISNRFDREALKRAHPEIEAQFVKQSESQRVNWKPAA